MSLDKIYIDLRNLLTNTNGIRKNKTKQENVSILLVISISISGLNITCLYHLDSNQCNRNHPSWPFDRFIVIIIKNYLSIIRL